MQRKLTLSLALIFLGYFAGMAQSSSAYNPSSVTASISSEKSLLDLDDSNWSLYADEENRLYYIDFESLSINLSTIVVRRQDGEIVLSDDVFDLPVNTIYEIDFNQYGSGDYTVELRSFTGVLRRNVAIR